MIIAGLRPFLIASALFILLNLALNRIAEFPSVAHKLDAVVANRLPLKLEELSTEEPKSWNVLALGTSLTDDGFSPQVFDTSRLYDGASFNMGLPASRYDVLKNYLAFHLTHYKKPRVVLIEVTDYLLNKNNAYYYMPAQYYQTLIARKASLNPFRLTDPGFSFEDRKEIALSSISSLYRYRAVFSPVFLYSKALESVKFKLTSGSNETKVTPPVQAKPHTESNETQVPLHGWHPRFVESYMKSAEGPRRNAEGLKKVYLDNMFDMDFNRLKLLVDFCRQNDIQVVLVQWPNHPEYARVFRKSKLYQPFRQGLASLTRDYQLPFIDLNQEIPENTSALFADTRHLSREGAEFFTRTLAEKLKTMRQPLIAGQSHEASVRLRVSPLPF